MSTDRWRPRCPRPPDLVPPVRIDPRGIDGPTASQARAKRWVRVAHGWYVDSTDRPRCVEQRILEQAARLPAGGAVSAWASLRWRGAGFFDGTASADAPLPVRLVMGAGGNLRPSATAAISWEQFAPWERVWVHGLPCTTARRSLFDEMRRVSSMRAGVVAADMAIAAGLLTEDDLAAYVGERPAWTGVPRVRKMLPYVDGRSVSPQESWLRLVWMIDAGLPAPLCNPDLFTASGTFLGRPDLLDPSVGLIGEYDGADHLLNDRRRKDREREERFRDHGLEVVVVVRGELGAGPRVAARIRAAFERAHSSRRPQTWRLTR